MPTDIASMLDMERLQRFLLVAEMGSLTRAAAAQGTTQSALSLQMAGLERACGGRLFYRTGRGVVLTELGERLQSRARALLRDAQALYEEMRSTAGIPHGEVSLGLLPSTTQTLVPLLLRQVGTQFPHVHLRMHEGSNGQLDEWLVSGRVDAAVISRYGPGAVSNDEALATIDSWLVGPRGDALTRDGAVRLAQLDGLPLILPSRPNGLRTVLDQMARDAGIRLSIPIEVDSIPTQKELVAEGFGYTILGAHAVQRERAAGTLQAARIVAPGIDRTITLSITAHHPQSMACRAVVGLLRTAVSQHLAQQDVQETSRPPAGAA